MSESREKNGIRHKVKCETAENGGALVKNGDDSSRKNRVEKHAAREMSGQHGPTQIAISQMANSAKELKTPKKHMRAVTYPPQK